MTNIALSLLRDKHVEGLRLRQAEDDILLRHNDPNPLSIHHNNSDSYRKPDNVFVRLDTARRLDGDLKATWETVARNAHTKIMSKKLNKTGTNLDWIEVLCSCEHKRTFNPLNDNPSRSAREAGHLEFRRILEREGIFQKKRTRSPNDEGSGAPSSN